MLVLVVVKARQIWFVESRAGLEASTRIKLLETLKDRTIAGGIHCILPAEPRGDVIPLAPDALQSHYGGWTIERSRRSDRRPPSPYQGKRAVRG